MMICGTNWVENFVGKGKSVGYQHFSFFHNVFKRLFSQGRKELKELYQQFEYLQESCKLFDAMLVEVNDAQENDYLSNKLVGLQSMSQF